MYKRTCCLGVRCSPTILFPAHWRLLGSRNWTLRWQHPGRGRRVDWSIVKETINLQLELPAPQKETIMHRQAVKTDQCFSHTV